MLGLVLLRHGKVDFILPPSVKDVPRLAAPMSAAAGMPRMAASLSGVPAICRCGLRYVAEYQVLAGPDRLAIGRLQAVLATAGSAGARKSSSRGCG